MAPLSVFPNRQGQGIGSALTKAGLDAAAEAGIGLMLVLGDQNYYGRFGFDTVVAAEIAVAWAGPYSVGLALTTLRRRKSNLSHCLFGSRLTFTGS